MQNSSHLVSRVIGEVLFDANPDGRLPRYTSSEAGMNNLAV